MRSTAVLCILGLLATLGGCNSYNLRYQAQPQPDFVHIYADYHLLQDAVGFAIDTDSRVLEDVFIQKPDRTVVRPLNIAYPTFGSAASIGPGIGVGAGPVGVGTGIAFPVGPEQARGLTSVTFSQATIGPPPWELHVKVHDATEATLPIGGPPTAKQ